MSLHNNSLLLPNLAVTKGKSASSTDKRIAPNALTLVVTAGLGALLGSSALAATSTATTTQEISGSTQSGGTTLETTITSANGNKVYIDTAEQGAVALGYNATTQAPGNNAYSSIAIGLNALAKGIQIDGSAASGAAIAIGDNASAREASIAEGSGADASAAQFASAFGTNATASGDRSTAMGINSRATLQWAVALGASSSATGPQAVALGGQSISSASSTVAIGSFTRATFHSAVAIGNSAAARNESATAIGRATTTYGKEGIAIGMSAKSGVASSTTESYFSGEKSIAIGSWASTLGYAAIALGNNSGVNGNYSAAIGVSNRIASSANNTLVFGNNVSATAANNVILGDGSSENSTTTTNGAFNQVNTATVGLLTYSGFKGTATGIVSVGANGKERQIINVAPGNISATSTDAINGSQLYATNGVLSNVANSTVNALGGTTVLNPNGTFNVTYNLTTTNPNDNTTTNYTSIGDALKGLSDAVNQPLTFKADEGSSVQKLGSTISIVSGNATDTSTENLKTNVTKDGTIEISFSTKPTFTNVTVNETLTVGNVTINATTGIDAGNTVITNVANGTNATDAVNVSQLKQVTQNITNVTNEVAKGWNVTVTASEGKVKGSSLEKVAMGDTVTVDAGKNIEITQSGKTISIATSATPTFTNVTLSNGSTSTTINVGGSNTTNVAGDTINRITYTDGGKTREVATMDDGLYFKGDSGDTISRPLNSTLSIVGGATGKLTDGNIGVEANATTGALTVKLAENVNLGPNGSVSVGNVTINNNGINAGNTQITNVANGTNATDAVNVRQLESVNATVNKGWNVTTTASEGKVNGSSKEKVAMGDMVTVDAGKNIEITQSGKTISIATSATPTFTNITLSNGTNSAKIGSDGNGNVRVTGKDGSSATKITNVAPGTNTTDAVNYGQLKSVEHKVDKLDGRVRGIGASSAAAASLPQVYIPGKSMVAASAGGYSGASAIAVGYSRASDSGKVILKLTGTANSEGHYSGGVGVGYQW